MTTKVNIIVMYVLCFMEWNVHFKQGQAGLSTLTAPVTYMAVVVSKEHVQEA